VVGRWGRGFGTARLLPRSTAAELRDKNTVVIAFLQRGKGYGDVRLRLGEMIKLKVVR